MSLIAFCRELRSIRDYRLWPRHAYDDNIIIMIMIISMNISMIVIDSKNNHVMIIIDSDSINNNKQQY